MGAPPVRAVFQVTVHDMGRAVRFYRDGLGATVAWPVAGPGSDFCIVNFGTTEVCLEAAGVDVAPDIGLALEVDDLEQACAAVAAAGGGCLRPPDKPWLAIVSDTEGNRLCVVARGGCFFHPSAIGDRASTSQA